MNNKSIITLEDFPKTQTFIYLEENYKNKLLNNAIKKAGSQRLLANRLIQNIQDLKLKQTYISSWLKRKNLRLDVIYWLSNYINQDLAKLQIKGIKGPSTTKIITNPKLSIYLTPELANILAKFHCDGCIRHKNCGYSVYYNKELKLIKEFKNNLISVFGNVPTKTSKINGVYRTHIPHFIGRLLYCKFQMNRMRVPDLIKQSNETIKSAYLRGVFDDEGSVNKKHGQIRLKMKYKSYINDVKSMLEKDFDIVCSKIQSEINRGFICYFFSISCQYNFIKFLNKVGFTHFQKSNILKNRIKNIKRKTYGYKAKNKVYLILKEKGPKTVKNLALILNRNKRTIQQHLYKLKKQNKTNYTKLKKKFVYEYLWYDRKNPTYNM